MNVQVIAIDFHDGFNDIGIAGAATQIPDYR